LTFGSEKCIFIQVQFDPVAKNIVQHSQKRGRSEVCIDAQKVRNELVDELLAEYGCLDEIPEACFDVKKVRNEYLKYIDELRVEDGLNEVVVIWPSSTRSLFGECTCNKCRQQKYRSSEKGKAAYERRKKAKRDATAVRRSARWSARSRSFDYRRGGKRCDSIGQPRPKGYVEKRMKKLYGPELGVGLVSTEGDIAVLSR
jgi:hypothetical protein